MSDLSDERVREWAAEPSEPGSWSPAFVLDRLAQQRNALAREVLALREELERERMRLAACGVAAMGNSLDGMLPEYGSASLDDVLALRERVAAMERERDVWRAKATHYDEAAGRDRARLLSEVATLTRQRDEAVAVAREAVAQAEALAGDGCHLDQALAALRARLAALQEGTDAHS